MEIFIAALAVYKVIQVLDALSPREAMPWVKIVFGVLLSYSTGLVMEIQNLEVSGLAIATIAGTIHSVLRLITLSGDAAQRRSLR